MTGRMSTGLSDADELRLLRVFLGAERCLVERYKGSSAYAQPWQAEMRNGPVFAGAEGPTRADAMVLAALRYESFMAEQASE